MSAMPPNDLSMKMRAYLAHVYRMLGQAGDRRLYISTSALADRLDVSAPAVNRMINRLKELGLLEHEPYQGIRLTDEGTAEALKQLRYHRIAEVFLVKVMGFGWHEVHDEAERIADAMSEAVTQRMSEMAGHPTHCPHGEPIPAPDGTLVEPDDSLLTDAQTGGHYQVTRILTREGDRLKYIEALGLLPETPLEVLHVAPFNGPMQLKLKDEYRIIGHNLAELIRIKALH